LSEKIMSFRDLRIWQKSMELVEKVYSVTDPFPKAEIFGLVSQMRRSAVSIPSNISEGFRRKHSKEYKQFLSIALGSCGELETQIEIACRLKFISKEIYQDLIARLDYICRMIQTLLKKL